MRLSLSTRHRQLLILTGDDARNDDTDDTDGQIVVSIDSADLTPAPDIDDDPEPDDDEFGFRCAP